MLYASFKNEKDEIVTALYDNFEQLHKDIFSPLTEVYSVIGFTVHGKTYAEKQASLFDTARRFQYEDNGGLYMGEYAWISDWFYKNGKRYGLLRDFRENCIC